ncbi:nitronate monooxygenase [Microbacterium sp. LRZ72]|uniref:NAD(P)H-dependent flavin oxidoreductase n=1 Tax=Microbacterium sp. LRZ72 TaxID=2942481 RepID=UPI0029B1A429|nr:DUF561 domain-containing protein [Microbacterium sp. LRZ72]MDX2375900.1 nitronate monooxygenase [Microbacterium sp. LRZ72]
MRTRLTDRLGLDLPIVLGPFGGLSSVELTTTVSNGGALGSYGLYGYTAGRIHATARALAAGTGAPFALNLWLPTGTERNPAAAEWDAAVAAAAPLFGELGLPLPDPPAQYLPPFDEQLDAVLDCAPAALSFVYGVPSPGAIEAAGRRRIAVIGTATTVDEAVALEAGGVDMIVASGAEAAGHRVSFLEPEPDSAVGTFALVPQVVDAVSVPVIAAGGIADRRGVAAALALGAEGVQVGTAFLRTRQSAANDAHKSIMATTGAHQTVLTRAMSGRLARGARNRAVETIESGGAIAAFPAQNWLTGQFRTEAMRRGIGDLQSLWLGQAAPLARLTDAQAVLAELALGLAR